MPVLVQSRLAVRRPQSTALAGGDPGAENSCLGQERQATSGDLQGCCAEECRRQRRTSGLRLIGGDVDIGGWERDLGILE